MLACSAWGRAGALVVFKRNISIFTSTLVDVDFFLQQFETQDPVGCIVCIQDKTDRAGFGDHRCATK